MEKKSFFIFMAFLISTVCLTKKEDFVCSGTEYNIALIYDCRYSLQLQQDFFFEFLVFFKPFDFYINIIQMTYGKSNLLIIDKLTRKKFTKYTLDESSLQLNTSSCPQHLPLKTLFNDTRDALSGVNKTVTKLAIFVLSENLTEYENDDVTVLSWLENEQSLNVDVKRLFILVKPSIELEVKNRTLIYTSTLTNYEYIVMTIIKHICNLCSEDDHDLIKIDGSCYNVLRFKYEMAAWRASSLCHERWPYTRLVSFNSKSEYEQFISQWSILLENITHNCQKGVMLYDYIDCNTTLVNGTQVITFDASIGLLHRGSSFSEGYTWDDRTPLSFDPPWGSRIEGERCVYMSQNYYYTVDVITKGHLEWNTMDCYERKGRSFVICEFDITDVKKRSLNPNDVKPKRQESQVHLLYTSYSHLLRKFMNNKFKNQLIFLMEQNISINFSQKECQNVCQKYKESNETYLSKHIETNSDIFPSTPSKRQSCEINQINCPTLLFNGYNHMCRLLGESERKSIHLNNSSSFETIYLRKPSTTVATCLYEIDTEERTVVFSNYTHLQDCKKFECPPGFFKCPDSYCIPFFLVNDRVKNCPHGEDEGFNNYDKTMCAGKLKFTLRNICLQQEICRSNGQCITNTNEFVCQVPCDTGYVCVSNIVRDETSNDTTFYITFVETTVQIFENLGLFTFTPQIYSFLHFFKLVEVDLSYCRMRDLDGVLKSLDSSDVIILDVSQNSISGHNNFSVIREMNNLQKLNMSFNNHLELGENFTFPLHLRVLDLSHTKCDSVIMQYLVNMSCLMILELRNVEPIDLGLTVNVQLDILDVRGTELINLKYGYLNGLSIQTALYTDDFRICCQVIRGPNITEDKCHAPRDAISSCKDLIGDPQKRFILWVVGILSLLGNMVVVIYRIVWDRAVFNKAYGLFVFCLGVSDFIMGIYLLIIAGADLIYRSMYVLEDSNWRYSNICKLAGIMSTFSSETSTMFICLITLDRYLVIKYPFGQHRFSKRGKITSLCLTLIIGVVVSVIPVLFPGWEIYSSNGMCLALPFSSGRHTGWEYSAILFVGLNFFIFIFIAIGQLAIFLAITSYKHDSFFGTIDDLRKAQELSIAKQLFIVAFSDFCCWFPIGIMGIMSLNGFEFNLDVYAWSAVLVLPVNSAINPLIYTLPAILRKITSVKAVSYLTSRKS